ncbi:hypothetical protein [Cellulomonas sp. S1-8]|uniref:hypothetical protein n=1 Tax=Cellulomonas sp. S1-8 TaxID=2904790 RepID=UPI002244A68F|nr:hypothetical protein [Cellulomonas sp. S1-8]UZN03407.1 hypothetical protein OKX07_00225 [Cellulomonas sp. S1-8]
MTAGGHLQDQVQSFCPIPPGQQTVTSSEEARAVLLAPRYTTRRDVTSVDLYRDETLDARTRLASFFNSWPMYSEGAQHAVLRRLTRQIVAAGTEPALAGVERVLADALPPLPRTAAADPFDWVADVSVPVSAAVVGGLLGPVLPRVPVSELVALGAALMLQLSRLAPGPATEQAALAAGARLADIAELHRDVLDEQLECAGTSSELIGGALAQIVTGALDPLQAAVSCVPLLPGEKARAVVAQAAPFRFVRRIDTLAPGAGGVRVPLVWPEPGAIPFGFGAHRCTAAALTEQVVALVVDRVDAVAPDGLVVVRGALAPAAFLRFEDLWVSHR